MATRQNTLLIKRSNVIDKIPPISGLTIGELALNTADAKLYTIFTSGTTGATEVREIGWDRIHRTGDTVTGDFNFFGDIKISGSPQPNGYALAVTGDTDFFGDVYIEDNLITSAFTANTVYVDYIDFNQNYTGGTTQGRINWDSGTGTLNIGIGDVNTGLIDLQVGQEEVVRVYNNAGSTLLKGEIVYVSGSQGNRPAVKRAIATSDGYSVTTLGMVDRDIDAGDEGYVTTFGIISNLNTLGLTGGTPIFLSPTVAGGYTSIKPQAPEHIVLIGYVVRVSATVGSIFINISNGWEIDELHDVRIINPTQGDLLTYSSYSGSPVWINTKTLLGNYTISGNTSHIGNFNITGNTSQIGNLNVTGLTELNGLTTVYGNTPNSAAINPGLNDTYDLGNPSYRWREIWTTNIDVSNSASIAYLIVNATSEFYDTVNFNNGGINITGNTSQVGDFYLTGNTIIQSGITAATYNISSVPVENNTLFQILGRNETTGEVEYRQVNTIGNNVTILTGGTYSAQTTIDNVIGVDTSLTTTTIYLPDSVTSGRLRFEIKDIGLNAYNNPITIIAAGTDTIISYTNSQTLIMESEGGAIILFNTGLGQWWQM
jgi:hypothetical protein